MNANLKYEIQANAFYRLTGRLAPGKDDPTRDDRSLKVAQAIWNLWQQEHGTTIVAMLESVEDVMR